jgi:hypothetical protein
MLSSKTNNFLYFLLGLLVADLIYSLYFYLNKEIVKINQYIIQPGFFLAVIFVDIIIIAIIYKMLSKK